MQGFLPRLQSHLLSRLLDHPFTGEEEVFTPAELNTVCFKHNRLYRHKVVRINYTTYDVRRAQDSLNPRTHADFMVLSHETEDADGKSFPYWFGRIVGIFHADILHTGPHSKSSEPQRMEFLWVRWFGRDTTHKSGFKARRLHRVGFVPADDPEAFGFLDPQEIIRAAHLIPAFHFGRTGELLGPSIVRQPQEKDEDWQFFYVNM